MVGTCFYQYLIYWENISSQASYLPTNVATDALNFNP